ncbi:MAG TPA: protocatechuate 3,4-dioxygenase subunit alpha [Alphaproteobacteria bacterium]|nr:protocatechuate 3,4-dioxygenase subunit alpha [Alphaproteobacteria bacterium]
MPDNQSAELFGQTPAQTIGPFFHFSLPWCGGADLVGQSDLGARPDLVREGHHALNRGGTRPPTPGDPLEIFGRVLDGAGAPVGDALIEVWQANAHGRYAGTGDPRTALPLDAGFIGFGRAATAEDGTFSFRTIRPGPVPGPGNTLQAPHIAVGIFARGLLKRLTTRIYFTGAPENEDDPVLALVPVDRRETLLAKPTGDGWQFDIILQGEGETVFFVF